MHNYDIMSRADLAQFQSDDVLVGNLDLLGKTFNLKDLSYPSQVDLYKNLLVSCIYAKEQDDHPTTFAEISRSRASRVLTWLESTDFLTAPASTRFHDSVRGGLLYHSLSVLNNALILAGSPQFEAIPVASITIVCLVHDWCKIGLYKTYMKNVKDDRTGIWSKVEAYTYRDDRAINLGHGASSMYLAMKAFRLNIEECSAIRWHMGRWNCVETEFNELQQVNRQYPLAHLLQFADQLSITDYAF